ncbi:hypothetical protein [Paenibacillus sp. KS-LC4]|uniref:hypothetical protein n=1 Tax=Paenibacillus sp. KS-LC4 TaxID=2979727 RepID=UPI0030D2E2E4
MEFDFFLRVMQDRFNMDGDYRSLEFMFSDTRFNLKKKSDSEIFVQTDELKLTIEASQPKIDKNNESFAENITYINLARVVILKDIHIKNSSQIVKVVELLLSYFHVLVVEKCENLKIAEMRKRTIKLEDVIINNEVFQVFCDPSTL